jgi:hypothetical protein
MNIIQELTEKYNGKYSEKQTTSFSGPTGKYSYQPKKGILNIDGTKISINLNEVGGAMYGTEPFRIILYLDKKYGIELNMFPKSLWNRFIDLINPNQALLIPRAVRKEFSFEGNKSLIKQIVSDKTFIENIKGENIYIGTIENPTNRIVLTPSYGIRDIEQFEKFVDILKHIENKVLNCT